MRATSCNGPRTSAMVASGPRFGNVTEPHVRSESLQTSLHNLSTELSDEVEGLGGRALDVQGHARALKMTVPEPASASPFTINETPAETFMTPLFVTPALMLRDPV